MKHGFSQKVRERLRHYVYLYIDPRDERPFYIGKGCGNRAFAHLNDGNDCEKSRRIAELRKLKLEPRIEILKYGLTADQALLVETTAIDLLGITDLTNEVRGHGCRHGSRSEWREIEHELSHVVADITDRAILINIRNTYPSALSPQQLYDATRSAWRVNPRRNPEYAMAVYHGVIKEVYEIKGWFPEGSTFIDKPRKTNPRRLEFVGCVAAPGIRERYIGKRVEDMGQNPVRYENCCE